jgi:hypothetical protein
MPKNQAGSTINSLYEEQMLMTSGSIVRGSVAIQGVSIAVMRAGRNGATGTPALVPESTSGIAAKGFRRRGVSSEK